MAYFNDVPGYLANFGNSDLLNEVLIYASGKLIDVIELVYHPRELSAIKVTSVSR